MRTQPTIGTVGRGTLWSMVNNISGQALSLLVFLVTARFVPKDAFGIMAVSLLTVEAFRQVVIASFGTALTAQKDPTDRDYNACFLLILLSGICSAGILFLLAGPIAGYLGHSEIESTLKLMCLILLTAGLSQTHEVWLGRHLLFGTLALRSVCSILLGGGIGIYLAINGFGLNALIAQQIVTAVTAAIFLWGATGWKPGLTTERANLGSLLHRSKHLFLSRFTSFAGTQSDVFFSSSYLGPSATGTYNAAKRILFSVSSTLSSVHAVALPTFAALGHGSERLSRGFLKAVSLTSLVTAPLYCGLFVLSDDAVRLLMGEKWVDAAPILSAMIIGAYVSSIGQYNHNIFLVNGKPQWEALLNIVYTVSNLLLCFWLARYGAVMLAVAYSARSLILYPLSLLPALYLLKMSTGHYLRSVYSSVVSGIGMAFCVFLIKTGPLAGYGAPIRLILLIPIGAILYFCFIYILNRQIIFELRKILTGMFKI